MKTLKLNHELAEMVRKGIKTSTWRIYDDKDIRVNDQVALVDKVVPTDPTTWQTIGVVRINEVVEKRLGDIQKTDFEGNESFSSQEEMVQTYQKYYGPEVSLDTPIKMIYF